MFSLPTSSLPSRGLTYSVDTLEMRPLGITEMMLISEAIETNDDGPFVHAIQSTTNIPESLTLGDFYLLAAIQRIITFTKSPIQWTWTCTNNIMTIILEDDASSDLVSLLVDLGFLDTGEKTFVNMAIQNYQDIVVKLEKYKGQFIGSLDYCNTENIAKVTPELLLESTTQIAGEVELEEGYALPTTDHVAEYKKLAVDDRLRKLLPLVNWLTDERGRTLADRIDTLRRIPDGMDVLDKASAYDVKYQHGLRRDILCPNCTRCGARTDTQRFPVTASSFYRR